MTRFTMNDFFSSRLFDHNTDTKDESIDDAILTKHGAFIVSDDTVSNAANEYSFSAITALERWSSPEPIILCNAIASVIARGCRSQFSLPNS
jgi:hypothetical protein